MMHEIADGSGHQTDALAIGKYNAGPSAAAAVKAISNHPSQETGFQLLKAVPPLPTPLPFSLPTPLPTPPGFYAKQYRASRAHLRDLERRQLAEKEEALTTRIREEVAGESKKRTASHEREARAWEEEKIDLKGQLEKERERSEKLEKEKLELEVRLKKVKAQSKKVEGEKKDSQRVQGSELEKMGKKPKDVFDELKEELERIG